MLRQALGAEFAAIHRVHLQRPHSHGLAVADSDLHAAAHRTIATSSGDPVLRDAFHRGIAGLFIARVGILVRQNIQTHQPFEIHAATPGLAEKAAAMLLGTTLTKNSRRPMPSPTSANRNAAASATGCVQTSGAAQLVTQAMK